MKHWMESYAAKLTAGVQTIGVGLDPEVLMLPGGSIMALVLWLYEHRPQAKAVAEAADVHGADSEDRVGEAQQPPIEKSLH
jgi:predicted NBD/HSP70 family sugar kinase